MSETTGLNRREFFQLVGSGVVVFIGRGVADTFSQMTQRPYPEDINAYLSIGADGRIRVFTGKIEMGQGVMTSQAQMAAEELGVDLDAIDMTMGDTDLCPWDMGTFGSLTTRMFGPALRAAAAEAKAVLLQLAAERLHVSTQQLRVSRGSVFVADDPQRRLGYGELAKGQRITRLVNERAMLRQVADFQVMGRPAQRLDGREKVTGAAVFAADVRRTGMLYARVLRPPAHGARLLRVDTGAAERFAGARVIKTREMIAVLHADYEAATAALALVKAQWSSPPVTPNPNSIFSHLRKAAPKLKHYARHGDISAVRDHAKALIDATYYKGYVAHAPLEPHAAIAEVSADKVTVWASTQTPFPTRDRIAAALRRDPKSVRVITPYLGGGFGGKSAAQQAVEAAQLAERVGQPVQVAWDRAEEFFYDRFDPACVVNIISGCDANGQLVLFDSTVYAAGERGAVPVYDIANLNIRGAGGPLEGAAAMKPIEPPLHPFDIGPWRAPGANMNTFAIESQIDAMAAAVHLDPLEFRLRHLSDPRMRRALRSAADAFGYRPAVGPSGRGYGIACAVDAGSYVATIASVAVENSTGNVRVLRVVCAEDLGIVVNPEGARMQIEGCVTMGLGYSLSEELQFRGGEILDRNFDSYQLPRFSDLPQIEAILVPNDTLAPQGGGEPPITTMGAVLSNAIFDATGARLRRLPMTSQRVRAALQTARTQPNH